MTFLLLSSVYCRYPCPCLDSTTMSTLLPAAGLKLNHRTPSPAIPNRPNYLDIQAGGYSPTGSGATTPHGHPLPSYFRPGPNRKEITPVPYAKLLPLCLARSAEGMIASIIMPYVNEMILSFGVNENDVGIWSAIAVSPCYKSDNTLN